jgi:hypothetical protein
MSCTSQNRTVFELPRAIRRVEWLRRLTSRGNVPLPEAERADAGEPVILQFTTGAVKSHERLGGASKRYYRAA